MARKEAIKNTKNGVTKKAINRRQYQHSTQSDLAYSEFFWNSMPVIIAILDGFGSITQKKINNKKKT